MKTTIELPDELFRMAKATAALRGESLKALIANALKLELARLRDQGQEPSWKRLFGAATAEQIAEIDRVINGDLARVDPADWQ